MPKNSQYQADKPKKDEEKKVHPIWRGVGCVSMFIIPGVSYVAADWLLEMSTAKWLIIPEEIVVEIFPDPMVFVKIVYAGILTLLIFFVLAAITFIVNKIAHPRKR